MKEYIRRYFMLRRHNMKVAIKKAKMSKMCYAFLAHVCNNICLVLHIAGYNLYFLQFYLLQHSGISQVCGGQNYINLILQDDVFLMSVKKYVCHCCYHRTVGLYRLFPVTWLINELPRWVRTIAVVVFYAPSIAGNAYVIFSIFFRGDAYGYVNAALMNMGII